MTDSQVWSPSLDEPPSVQPQAQPAAAHAHSHHARTLTQMLSPIPSEGGEEPPSSSTSASSASSLHRSHSEPAESKGASESKPLPRELKAFDPYAALSPPTPARSVVGQGADADSNATVVPSAADPRATSGEVMPPALDSASESSSIPALSSSSATATVPSSSAPPRVSDVSIPPSAPASATPTPLSSDRISFTVGSHTSVANVSSYSSAALSSGTFTAISVSPVPSDLSTPPTGRLFVPSDVPAGAGASTAVLLSRMQSPPQEREVSVVVSQPPRDALSTRETLSQQIAHLQLGTDSSPFASADAPPPLDSVDSTTSQPEGASSVRFGPATTIESLSAPAPSSSGAHSPSPRRVRVHAELDSDDGATPMLSPPDTASSGASSIPSGIPQVLSPSFPRQHSSPHEDESSPRDSDSPLPPVVSALMAAQKVAGASPGTTLALPHGSGTSRVIMLCGDASGAGKSSVAMGLLHLFLKRGYSPSELAYIKPCTQCEDVQIVSKYCEKMGIAHRGLGPVIFYEGFTAEVIDGKTESVESRRERIRAAVNKIAEGKKWVLVDGVGYAAVGSVAGVSNAEVASLLNAPVVVVGRPGIGNAIDSMNFILSYFSTLHVRVVGACWNRVPPVTAYHTYERCKQYVNKYFRNVRPGVISTYGHLPLIEVKKTPTPAPAVGEEGTVSPPPLPSVESVSCRLRPAKKDLALSEEEEEFVAQFNAMMEREFAMEQLLTDLNKYYQAHRVQLVSVV